MVAQVVLSNREKRFSRILKYKNEEMIETYWNHPILVKVPGVLKEWHMKSSPVPSNPGKSASSRSETQTTQFFRMDTLL